MATYTGVADANGDFTVPFSSSYTGGQKITVTAEKDSATKSIELFAPSSVTGGGIITWTGTTVNFPESIGEVALSNEVNGAIANYAFYVDSANNNRFGVSASGLSILNAISIGSYAFHRWINSKRLIMGNTVKTISSYAFYRWYAATEIQLSNTLESISDSAFGDWSGFTGHLIIPNSVKTIGSVSFGEWINATKLTLGSGILSIGSSAFGYWNSCSEINCLATKPPTIASSTFYNLPSSCTIKVPSASLAAYQTAANWSAHASKMIGV